MGWKLLIGIVLILIFLSSSYAGNLGGLKDKLFSFFSAVGDKIKSVPLDSLFSISKTKTLNLIAKADILEINPDDPVVLQAPDFQANEFTGNIKIDFGRGKVTYTEEDSKLSFNTKLEGDIQNLKFKRLILENLSLQILNESWEDVKTNHGAVEIYDFSGKGVITPNGFELIGNVSDFVRK